MKITIDEIQPWNIAALAEDIQQITSGMGPHAVWVWHGGSGGNSTLLRNPTLQETEQALARGAAAVIVKRTGPEPGEPAAVV